MRFCLVLAPEELVEAELKGETLKTFVSLINESDNVFKCLYFNFQ